MVGEREKDWNNYAGDWRIHKKIQELEQGAMGDDDTGVGSEDMTNRDRNERREEWGREGWGAIVIHHEGEGMEKRIMDRGYFLGNSEEESKVGLGKLVGDQSAIGSKDPRADQDGLPSQEVTQLVRAHHVEGMEKRKNIDGCTGGGGALGPESEGRKRLRVQAEDLKILGLGVVRGRERKGARGEGGQWEMGEGEKHSR